MYLRPQHCTETVAPMTLSSDLAAIKVRCEAAMLVPKEGLSTLAGIQWAMTKAVCSHTGEQCSLFRHRASQEGSSP